MDNIIFKGKVIAGSGDGRKIKIPTANIEIDPNLFMGIPLGVYASIIKVEKKLYKSITHIGPRAVFSEEQTQVEVHIFDFERNIYGMEVEIKLLKFIRETLKFESLDDMVEQIKLDIKKAQEYLQTFIC